MSVWHYPNYELPENGRKIEMILSVTGATECDTWDNGLVLGEVKWEKVILWRYVDER